jgi:hypothetical protein
MILRGNARIVNVGIRRELVLASVKIGCYYSRISPVARNQLSFVKKDLCV